MAQINLLKQSASGEWQKKLPKILAGIFWVVLASLVGYYIWQFFNFRNLENQVQDVRKKINLDLKSGSDIQNQKEIFTRQAQLKSLADLVSKHVYWSQLMPEVARVTLKTAGYKSLTMGSSGELTINVIVPSLADLDKYMQVFDLPDYNQNFSNIRIGSFSKIQGVTSNSIQFQAKMDFNQEVIEYHDKNAKK